MSNRYENKKCFTKIRLIISCLQDTDVNLLTLIKGRTFARIQCSIELENTLKIC
jgi:hypothetical protein